MFKLEKRSQLIGTLVFVPMHSHEFNGKKNEMKGNKKQNEKRKCKYAYYNQIVYIILILENHFFIIYFLSPNN